MNLTSIIILAVSAVALGIFLRQMIKAVNQEAREKGFNKR